MLERIREGSQGPWAMAIIVLIVLSFVLAGVSSYVSSSAVVAAAEVNGEEISLQDVERAYQAQRARLEAQFGESIGALFSDENYLRDFRMNVLDRLIADTLVLQKAQSLGLRVSDEQIRGAIVQMPEFQTDGAFDNERYLTLLRQNAFQPATFSNYMRQQMTREQLARAVRASDFALPEEVKIANSLQQQTRDAEYIVVDSSPFAASVELSDDDVNSFYESNLGLFDTQEKVNVAYVVLSVSDLQQDVTVDDDEIEQFYSENKVLYKTAEERRVSHILIEFGENADEAKAKIESLAAALANGADFSELAKNNSTDAFSADNGGDLDFITEGMMDPVFDEAAFALAQVGDVSGVVETEFGYHLIKLTDLKPEVVTPLAEVSDEIRAQLALDKATDRFYALQTEMANLAFEVPDTLEDIAGILNTSIRQTGMVSAAMLPAPLNVPAISSRVFDPAFIEEGLNSDVIELNDDAVAVVRIAGHEPQRTQTLDEVRTRILAQLRADKAQQAAFEWATDIVEQIQAGETPSLVLNDVTLNWERKEALGRSSSDIPRALVERLFTLGEAMPASIDVAELGSGDVGIVKLIAINQPNELSDADKEALAQQIATASAQSGYQAFIDSLRANADVNVNL